MRIDVTSRHDRIVALLEQRGAMRTADLAEELDISPVTVRRDVAELAVEGRIARAHGRVMSLKGASAALQARDDSHPSPPAFAVGVLVPRTAYYYGDVIRAIGAVVARAGGRVVLGVSNDRAEEDPPQLRSLLDAKVNGIIATPNWPDGSADDVAAAELLALKVPIVLVERFGKIGSRVERFDHVRSDHAYGARLAITHLHEQGWRDMALVMQPTPTSVQLRVGYEAAVAQLGLTLDPTAIIQSVPPEKDPAAGEQIASALEARLRASGPFAALVHNDLNAMMIMQRLQGRGVRIPEDIGFVAYDDETADLADVPLTAVAPPKYAVGRLAAELMVERLAQQGGAEDHVRPPMHAQLLPALNVRASSLLIS
ncbi:substrate-binding domain-containing protein [Rathayibacter sp. CAU 1779]